MRLDEVRGGPDAAAAAQLDVRHVGQETAAHEHVAQHAHVMAREFGVEQLGERGADEVAPAEERLQTREREHRGSSGHRDRAKHPRDAIPRDEPERQIARAARRERVAVREGACDVGVGRDALELLATGVERERAEERRRRCRFRREPGILARRVVGGREDEVRREDDRIVRMPAVAERRRVGDELVRPRRTARREGDRVEERRLAEAVLPDQDRPHPRRAVVSNERQLCGAQELCVANGEAGQVHDGEH